MFRSLTSLGLTAFAVVPVLAMFAGQDGPADRYSPSTSSAIQAMRIGLNEELDDPRPEMTNDDSSTLSFSNGSCHLIVTGAEGEYQVRGMVRDDKGLPKAFAFEGTPELIAPKLKALPASLRALVLWQIKADDEMAPLEDEPVVLAPPLGRSAHAAASSSSSTLASDPIEALAVSSVNGKFAIEGAYRDASGHCKKFRCDGSADQVRAQAASLPPAVRDAVVRKAMGH